MIQSTIISNGEHAGGLDVIISGAESSMLMTLAYEQDLEINELLTRLITNATIRGQKISQPFLIK